ncbi:MAG: hypothetical protein R2942_05960 [Ignavibacteria bacterium]
MKIRLKEVIVEFSATSGGIGLPSGIYYYRLETENFKETKNDTFKINFN